MKFRFVVKFKTSVNFIFFIISYYALKKTQMVQEIHVLFFRKVSLYKNLNNYFALFISSAGIIPDSLNLKQNLVKGEATII